MSVRSQHLCLLILATSVGASCVAPEPVEQSVAPTKPTRLALTKATRLALAERARIAASGRALAPLAATAAITTADGQAMVNALDIPAGMNPTFVSGVSPDPEATLVIGRGQRKTSFGTIRPTNGDSFLLLSTGRTGDDDATKGRAEPGTDFDPPGVDGDVSTLRFRVTVPAGANRLSFDYTFLSAESPDFIGSQFNDTFTATVSDTLGANRVIATASVNTATFHPASATTVGSTPFLLYVDNASGVNQVFDNGLELDAGTTEYQKVSVPIASAVPPATSGVVTVQFDIRDLGDGILDSAVIIDNVQFSALEMVDPHGSPTDALHGSLIDAFFGRVLRTPEPRLVTQGLPVRSVVADGVTQIVLRSNVPGPGSATFSLTSGAATDGSLSNDDGAPVWGTTATTNAVRIGTGWYVFALYRSPPDFNRGGDGAAPVRSAALNMTYTSTGGTGFSQDASIGIIRPPVVVVPDIWSSCLAWADHGSIMDPHPENDPDPDPRIGRLFNVSCAEHQATSSQSFDIDQNQRLVADAIDEALTKQRDVAVAATRVDVIGHGMGGLLARRYIDHPSFLRFDNFNAGPINRLILTNTPNFGSRLADEIVRMRDFWKQRDPVTWASFKTQTLEPSGIRLDDADGDVALQQMGMRSAVIDSVGINAARQNNVFYHALIGANGHNLNRTAGLPLVSSGIKSLFIGMENNDPDTINLTPPLRQNLIFGRTDPNASMVFCRFRAGDAVLDLYQHDLFATTPEQRGGLDLAFTTTIPVTQASLNSGHYRLQIDREHSAALTRLLDAPVNGGSFSTSMPPPHDVTDADKGIGCPAAGPAPPFLAPQPEAAVAASALQAISITSPATGTTVTPGSTVSVTVDTGPGDPPESVLITSLGNSVLLEQPPFTTNIVIPVESAGAVRVAAVAFYGHGGMAFAQPVALTVQVTATVTAIEILGGDVALQRPGRKRQLIVVGTYSDGVRRDITSAAVGTRYASSELAPVADVSADGLITAEGPGDATIAISNGSVITSINAKVGASACGDGVLDPGEQCDDGNVVGGDHCDALCRTENAAPFAVCASPTPCNDPGVCSANVTDLAAGSSDPEGDELSFTQSPAGPYAVGHHVVSVDVSDGSLDAQCTSEFDVLDCERPTLSCPADFAAECTGDRAASVTPPPASATDNCGVTVHAPAAASLALGSHELAYSATDPSDNAASCVTTVTVQDTAPPTVACPAAKVAECTGNGQAVVDPGDASASDLCTTATVSHPGASAYALGTTSVEFAAVDEAGNRARCATSVTVQDTIAPTLSCPTPKVAECTSHGQATVDPGHAAASDICTAVSVSEPGSVSYALGTTPVTFTAADQSGNRASCVTTVTVRDTTAPALMCPAPTIAECTGDGRAVVDPGSATATEACTSSVVSHPGPSSYPLGNTPVGYTATDEAGNQASCSTSVTVRDTTAPAITCPAPIVAECTGHSRAFVRPEPASSSDVCTDVTVTQPRPEFFPLGTTVVTYTSNDTTGNHASCSSTIQVVDTRPPQVTVDRTLSLSPPDHRYRTVHLADCGIEVGDRCGGRLDPSVYRAAITCVTSDERDDARGGRDGHTDDDIVIVDDTTVKLRAERDAAGDGRVYKIQFQVRDASGNTSDGVCEVDVPRDDDCGRSHHGDHGCRAGDGDVENSVCR